VLASNCKTEKEKADLISGYEMLMNDMGAQFFFMSLLPKVLQRFGPSLQLAGFY